MKRTIPSLWARSALLVTLLAVLAACGVPRPSPTPMECYQWMKDAIDAKYSQVSSTVGPPADGLYHWVARNGGGCYRQYAYGYIFYNTAWGAHEVHGGILERYLALGGPQSYLGYPTTDETTEGTSQFNAFSGGWIYWSGSYGAADTPYRVHQGLTYTGLDTPNWVDLRDWTAASPATYLYRRNVVKNAFIENELGLCMPQASSRYCTGGGTECWGGWCSELAHYILLMNYGGVKNISGPGYHNDLGDAYTIGGFESVFKDNSTHPQLWVPYNKINEWTIEPGDYLAVQNGNHSTIVVGVKWDRTQVWTVERVNQSSACDCVGYKTYPYKKPDGTINSEFYGVGKLHCDIVDPSACTLGQVPTNDWDLSAAGVCYSVNEYISEISVRGVIQNVGKQTIDFGVNPNIPGPNNAPPKGSYAVGADVGGAPHYEQPGVLTKGGLLLKPGEKSATSQGVQLPFHPNWFYANFEFVVGLEGVDNTAHNRYRLFQCAVTGAQLVNMQEQYKCPW